MKRVIASLIVLVSLAGTAAADQDLTFETVDEVANGDHAEPFRYTQLQVRGLLEGQTEPFLLQAALDTNGGDAQAPLATRCERMALLAMARPGRYLLRIMTRTGGSNGRLEVLRNCRLIRR